MAPNTFSNIKHIHFAPAVGWGILLSILSLTPGNKIPDGLMLVSDKIIHAGIYFLAASLIYLGFIRYNFTYPIAVATKIYITIGCVLYGGVIELLQYYVIPQRSGDWYDFIANTIGSLASVLLLQALHRRKA